MKSNKALKLGVLVLSLGALAACGDDPATGEQGGENGGAHVCVADTAAGYQTSGTKHYYKCTDPTCKKQVDAANHSFGAEEVTSQPTCTEAGAKKQTCSVCNYVKTGTVSATGHTYDKDTDGNDVVTVVTEPGCETKGAGTKTCKTCSTVTNVEIDELGHNFAKDTDGNIVKTWTKPVTCTEDGTYTQTCSRCGENTFTQGKLGHDIQLIADDTEAEEGKAKVRLYRCVHDDCTVTYFGFRASEVTEESKSHLVIDENGGARFWGRPIGNDVKLDANGSPSQDDHEAVFNPTQTGDFFEYKFDLTQEQADQLGNVRCYVDVKPAQYLGTNGMDFFACKSGDTDWTRGMYIDGKAEHVTEDIAYQPRPEDAGEEYVDVPYTDAEGNPVKVGKEIDDYRYVLYVDNEIVNFDSRITNPVDRDEGRSDKYVIPYTFNLHAGTNSISLRMAGGYRSTFYNFTFRAVEAEEEETEHVHEMVASPTIKNSNGKDLKSAACECGQKEVAVALSDGWEMQSNGKVDKTKEGSWTIEVDKDITGAKLYMSAKLGYDSHQDRSFYTNHEGASSSDTFESNADNDGTCRYFLKVNGEDQVITTKTWGELGLSQSGQASFEIATVNLKAGKNVITMTPNTSTGYSLYWGGDVKVAYTGDAVAKHVHEFNAENACGCGAVVIASKAAVADATISGSNKAGTPDGFLKLGSNTNTATYTFEATEAGKAHLMVVAGMDSWPSNGDQSMFSGDSTNGNIKFTVNGAVLSLEAFRGVKYSAMFGSENPIASGYSGTSMIDLGEIDVVSGANTIVIERVASYNILISTILIVK